MNIKTKLTAAAIGALGLALAGTAFAAVPDPDITIYIAGANGDRKTANQAIDHLLGGSGGSTWIAGSDASDYKAANYAIFQGTFGGQTVRIKTSYIGATAGIAGVAGGEQDTIKFLKDSVIDNNPKAGGATNDPTKTAAVAEERKPNIALSTNFQASSPFIGNYNGRFYDGNLVDEVVAVVPMIWIASPDFPGDNITTQQAQLLFLSGYVPASVFTGNPAHRGHIVYATGRNLDAGQRFVAQTESGIGLFTHVRHYAPAGAPGSLPSSNNLTISGPLALFPRAGFVSSIDPQVDGNNGVDTGANLGKLLTATLSQAAYQTAGATVKDPTSVDPTATIPVTGGSFVSYITPGDGADAIAHNAKQLKWNGVAYSPDTLKEGQYTFWTYEHIFYKSNLAGAAKNFAVALAAGIRGGDIATGSGLELKNVYVERSGEGTIVSPSYF